MVAGDAGGWALPWLWLSLSGGLCLAHDPRALFLETFSDYANLSRPMGPAQRLALRERVRHMFTFGWDNYMRHAFPMDELDPIHCTGRGPDYENPANININDVLGDYCLTLVDSLDTLAVMGNRSEFHRAVRLAAEYVSFEKDNVVQVFEATIRILGALLSAHLILTDRRRLLGDMAMLDYEDELLHLAVDLAERLKPAFHPSPTGIPYPRVNLATGLPSKGVSQTCLAGAGSLALEFGVLSRLTNDSSYERLARRANRALFSLRDPKTGLFGNTLDVETGEWSSEMAGVGAGSDSFYEYLLKSYILFGEREDYAMFNRSYGALKAWLRKGRRECNRGSGQHPLYANVAMGSGEVDNSWVDSLGAAWSGVQLLSGDVEEAICAHALYYAIWRKFQLLPERFNWQLLAPDVRFYPLRPEFAESTYLLYLSTRNPFYLRVGEHIVHSLETYTKVKCGYATVHDVGLKTLEDRMESFFLSETTKYLFLLFDEANPVNARYENFIFTTEGHILPIDQRFRSQRGRSEEEKEPETAAEAEVSDDRKSWEEERRSEEAIDEDSAEAFVEFDEEEEEQSRSSEEDHSHRWRQSPEIVSVLAAWNTSRSVAEPSCEGWPRIRSSLLPLRPTYMAQLDEQFSVPPPIPVF